MFCPDCNINYEDPNVRYCFTCGKPLEGASSDSPQPPRRKPRTTPSKPPETVVVRVGGRPRHIRRTYLIVFLLLLLLLLSCCCLLYTDILPMPAVVIDILGPFTPVVPGCGLGLVLIFICYIIIILFKLDFNCIYVPVGLLIMVVLCVILNIIGVVPLPDFVDRIVVVVTGPIRTLPLPWDPGPGKPEKPPDEEKPSGGCCPDFSFSNIYYEKGYLYFHINCRLESFEPQCGEGDVYDGSGNYWTAVSCCADPKYMNNAFICEGLDPITAKVGDVRLEMEYEGTDGRTCTIGANFSPPAFQKPSECPSGQSMCAGSCCSSGHCCDCGSGYGCYESCSGCD